MQLEIFNDYDSLSAYAADEMTKLLVENPRAVISMASGDSPKLACALFCQKAKATELDVSQFFFVGLDEWVGLPPTTFGSCHNDFKERLIRPLGLAATQYHLFDSMATDLAGECALMDRVIAEKGGIDLMIVGIGMNGHIGFNEPGIGFNLLSHVAELDAMTISVGQKYFKEVVALEKGITLGLGHLSAAKKVLLLANGERKAPVIQKAVEGAISTAFPASIMQQHANGFILVDAAAASLLNKAKQA